MTNHISRRAMLALAVTMCAANFAISPSYLPSTRQLAGPDRATHRVDVDPGRRAPPNMPAHQHDPFADLLLG